MTAIATNREEKKANARKFQTLVRLKKRRLMFVDPGTKCTGVSFFDIEFVMNTEGMDSFIKKTGFYQKPTFFDMINIQRLKGDLHEKTHVISGLISQLAGKAVGKPGCSKVFIEHPVYTVYGQDDRLSKGSQDYDVGRSMSVAKLMGLVYDMYATLRSMDIKVQFIHHNQWQPSKKARKGLSTKDWSVAYAHDLVRTENREIYSVNPKVLSDHNVADAVAMGSIVCQKLLDGVIRYE